MRHLLRDLPMQRKLLAAFMITVSLPLLTVALWSLVYWLDHTGRATQASLHDKLHIGQLILDGAGDNLLGVNKRVAGDNTVLISLGLGLTTPIDGYLAAIRQEQGYDYAFIASPRGSVLANGDPDKALEVQELAHALLPAVQALRDKQAAPAWGRSFWLGQAGSLVNLQVIQTGQGEVLGFSCIGSRLGAGAGPLGRRLQQELGAQTGAACFLASSDTLAFRSDALAGLALDLADLWTRLGQSGREQPLDIHLRTSWQALGTALPGWDGRVELVLGVALPDSELQQGRNATLAVTAGIMGLAVGLSLLMARFFARSIARPVAAIAAGTREIIKGNFDIRLEPQGRDEIGLMTEDFAVMAIQLQRLVGDLGREVEEHKAAEGQIRRLNEELEQRVAERTRELTESLSLLQETQRELVESEKMAALSHLVVGVAHELNTPLGNSLTASSFLSRRIDALEAAFQGGQLTRQDFQDTLRNLREAARLNESNLDRAGQLVGFFKQMAVDLEKETPVLVTLATLVDHSIHGLQARPDLALPVFDNQVPRDLSLFTCPSTLMRVLDYLVDNAAVHAFPSGQSGLVSFAAREDGAWLELSVSDNGVGIPLEELPRVFEPFFTTRHTEHAGLGLSIAYNLTAHRLGGQLQCQSQPGAGCRFVVRLPLAGPAA